MKTFIFAGTYHEYCTHQLLTTDEVGTYIDDPKDVPVDTEFAFYETGTYGNNPAWQHMRKLYGFAPDEAEAMRQQMMAKVRAYTSKRALQVASGLDTVKHLHILPVGVATGDVTGVAVDLHSQYHTHEVQMVYVLNNSFVCIGKIGKCMECGMVFYSLTY